MTRIFIDQILSVGQLLYADSADSHHLLRVLRMREGDRLTVCDRTAADFSAEISAVAEDRVELRLLSAEANRAESPVRPILYQCLPKGDKFDSIVRHAVELGVCEIVPVQSERSVVRLNSAKAKKKTERWQLIAESAARQAGRGIIPQVREVLDFSAAVQEMAAHPRSFVPWEGERTRSLSEYLRQSGQSGDGADLQPISFLIGPEGGLAQAEVALLQAGGLATVSLGPRILRTETAALCVLSMLIFSCEM